MLRQVLSGSKSGGELVADCRKEAPERGEGHRHREDLPAAGSTHGGVLRQPKAADPVNGAPYAASHLEEGRDDKILRVSSGCQHPIMSYQDVHP